MVAIVGGIRAGLELGSREVLGAAGVAGNAAEGRNGQQVFVNVANGLLTVQGEDDRLVAAGADPTALRTYNSAGVLNDDNGDQWGSGVVSLRLSGTVNTAGSSMQRIDRDGSTATYAWDAARGLYVTTEGAGAYDTLAFVAADNQFEWRDGGTGATQRFEGGGQRRLLASRDTSGNTLAYAYAASGLLSSVTGMGGEAQFYDYTGTNLTQVRTVVAGVTTTRVRYAYDASNRLATVTVDLSPADGTVVDGKVYQTTYAYEGTSKRIASIAQSDGTRLAFTYVDVGGGNFKVASVRDGLNQASTFSYGAGFTTVTDPLGLVTRYDHDAAGQLTKITAPAVAGSAASRQFAYNGNGDVVAVTDGEGRSVAFQYDASGNQVLQRDALGNTVTRTFDARNQLLTETVYRQPDPDGAGIALPGAPATTRQAYDAGGRNLLRFSVSAEGRVTEHRYSDLGDRIASITYAGAAYPVAALAPDAALAEETLVAWAATQDLTRTQRVDFSYDARGQVQSRTSHGAVDVTGKGIADASQSVERYVHDQAGRLLQTVSATNGTTSYSYDGLGRVLTATNAVGQVTVTQYADSAGKTVVTLASGLVTTHVHDAAGRLVAVQQSSTLGAALGETKYFYDAGNRLRMTQDPTGVRSWLLYDAAGRKVADIDGNGSLTEYSYDRRDLLVRTMRWGTAVDTAALVDAAGLPLAAVTVDTIRPLAGSADAATWRQYDDAQRLVREAASFGAGAQATVTEFRYDGAGRMVQTIRYANTVLADGSAGSVAPGAVPLPAAAAQDRSTRQFHDADGRLAGSLDAEGYLTVFRYDAAGRRTERIAYANATAAALRASGSLAELLPAASAADIRSVTLYDAKGQVVAEVDAEGYLTENVYDGNGQVTLTIWYANRVGVAVSAASTLAAIRPAGSAADRSTQRSYDLLGRVLVEVSREGVRTEYGYDAAGKLVSTVRAAATTEQRTLFTQYDLLGRLTGELSAQGAALLTAGQTQAQIDVIWAQHATRHAYDAAGRRTSSTDAAGNRTLFFYDADGALTHAVNALGEVSETRYDNLGRVTEQVVYANRIATAGLAGGLAPAALGSALAAVANAALDSRTTHTYTRDSRVASSSEADGLLTSFTYNAFGDEVAVRRTGTGVNVTDTRAVDRRGLQMASTLDAGGINAVTTTVYDAFGRVIRDVDARGNLRNFTYDRLGRVLSTRDRAGALRSTSYDAFGRVLSQTDALGNVTSYAYNAAARTMTVTTPEGIVSTTTYTRHGQIQSVADGKGQVTSYSYDRSGRLVQTTTPLTTERSSYDAAGRLLETVDGRGIRVAYSYDAASRVLTRRVDPAGLNLTTSYQYDAKGQRIATTDANGVRTTVEYDRKGRVVKQTVDPTGLNLQTLFTHDARGNTLTVRSPAGQLTQYVYDALGRRVQERVDPAGLNLQRSWAYDRNGNVAASVDGRGNTTRYAYDGEDRRVYTVDPLGNVRQESYDAEGRVVKTVSYATPVATATLPAVIAPAHVQPLVMVQAAQDAVEHRVYDKDGRVAATVDGTGAVTSYGYDANGNVVARTAYANRINLATWTAGTPPAPVADAARDAVVRTIYDGLDRAIYSMDGVGAVVAQAYDGNGNVLQRTAYATAIATNVTFTQAGVAAAVALVANAARDAVVRNTYDAAGRLTWSVDGAGAVTQRVYDRNGNVVRELAYATPVAAGAAPATVAASANDRATARAYDAANRLVFEVDALRGVTEQVFDADGHVVRRTAYATPIASVPALGTAATAGAIRAALVSNAAADRVTRFGYDAAGREALAIAATGAVTETQYDAAGNAVASIAYANPVNAAGLAPVPTLAAMKALVVANAVADRATKMAYDAAGRLVYTVDAVQAVTQSQYDGVGRLTRSTRYFTAIAATTANTAPAIAAALVVHANDRVQAFSYNAAGQRIAATNAIGGTESCTYDALGRKLTFVNQKGSTWTYTYDAAGRMLSETSPQVSLTSTSRDAALNIVADAGVNAAVVTRMAYDALGNLTQRTEAAGRPEERTTLYEYDALARQVRVIHPPVGVYNPAGDNLLANGAATLAARVETVRKLETRTFYDALGNAVASVDVGGAPSQKAYDLLGRVAYEVDAMGYVTGYARNAFGDVTTLTRYGARTTLAGIALTEAGQAAGKAQVEAAINALGVDHSRDRALLTSYDAAGRVVETSEPGGYFYDSSVAAPAVQAGVAARKTRNSYDAFGQLVQATALRNANTDTWSTTTHYFDQAGRETATVDAMGYLTRREFDTAGNLTRNTEYATAVSGAWSPGAFTAPAVHADDRVTEYTYDRLDRKTAELRRNVEHSTLANGTSARGTLTTLFAYDAVGNQTQVTDAAGYVTRNFYDAAGRVTAVSAPTRSSTAAGTALTPLIVFRRDAYGNVVVKTEYANGAAAATSAAPLAPDAADRTTLSVYDSFGRSIQARDANGANAFSSYDAYGHLAKQWQGVTGNDGVTRTAFEAHAYDALGQLVETRASGSNGTITATGVPALGVITTALEYNAFGELTRKGSQGGRQEYFDYDDAGRLWRTNTGDGVDRIQVYDLLGNVTAEIRSSGSGRENVDLKTFASAQAAADNPNTRRTDIVYDALGRVTAKYEAARQELQGGVSVQRQYTTATVLLDAASQFDELGFAIPASKNRVAVTWNSLSGLGSGDVKVHIEYRTWVTQRDPDTTLMRKIPGTLIRSHTSGVLNGDAHAAGATLEWAEILDSQDLGVQMVTRIVVYKKDINGVFQAVVDQMPGHGFNEITVAAPPDANTGVSLQLRVQGSPGDTGWWHAGLVDFGSTYRFHAQGLTAGNYEYRVVVTPANEAARVTATGVVAITQPPLPVIAANIRYGQVTDGVMVWDNLGESYTQIFRYRAAGSTGEWSALPVGPFRNGIRAWPGVDTRNLAPGSYQYEVLWLPSGQATPAGHATGTFTITPPQPAYWVPPVNLPNITGLRIGEGLTGMTISGYDENDLPIYSGGTLVKAFVWEAANATVARYRVPGGAWVNLAIDNTKQKFDESGPTGTQAAPLPALGPGTYEVQILAGSPPTAQATAIYTVYAQSPGYWTTVYVQVPRSEPVIAYYAPVYETRYAQRLVSYQVWVRDAPYISGYDEAGDPIWVYPAHLETRYYWEWYSYQVQVGQTPVYATDEAGNIIYQTTWVTEPRQQWVEGTTPPPTLAVTTPPYTPGYWVPAVDRQYGVSVTTAPNTGAISTTLGSQITQAAGLNGDARWLRPKVLQKTDRWGNVVEITDPRADYWRTTYRYNASNQLVQQVQVDTGTGSPVTSIYYDKLGREIAVRDANGNVNGKVFDAGGNLVQEVHADGGSVVHAYNAFGDKVRTVDAMGKRVDFSYDRLGNLLQMARGVVGVFSASATNRLVQVDTRNIVESWTYDQLGRKLSQTNGNGETLRYTYDLAGNLVETRQPLGQVVRAAYDAQGRKIREVDANGVASTWTYDYFGQLKGQVDLGGHSYGYAYDNAGQLTRQTSTRGQSINYGYDAAGQVVTIQDLATRKTTTYMYDLGGRRIRERVVQDGATYQDNHLAYDARGNLRDVADARAHVVMQYDRVGNRTYVGTFVNYQGVAGEVNSGSNRYFKYDAMNRQVVVDAVDAAGNLGTQGHRITYDKNGNRLTDTYWGPKVVTAGGEQVISGYDDNGVALYTTVPISYVRADGFSTEEYRYDDLNRLQSVVKDGVQIDVRAYDGAGRVIQSGPAKPLDPRYAEIINAGLAPDQMNGKETRVNRYDANGRLLHQLVLKSDHSLKHEISWDRAEAMSAGGSTYFADGYDAAGNVLGYTMVSHESGIANKYTTSLLRFEGYAAGVTSGQSSRLLPGTSTQAYDVNGHLVRITDSTQGANNRTFVNDAEGRALYVNQAGQVQRQLIVNGEVLGLYGAAVNPNDPASGFNNNPNFADVVDFDFGYARVSASYPSASPGAYTIRRGDTLQSIAQSAYGDSALWYRVAEANGLASNSDLKVGQTLNIPNQVSTIHNNASTFKPYDPSRIEGDKTPSLATPKPKKKSGLGALLAIVIVIVATVFSAGALTVGLGSSFGTTMSAGAGVLAGGGVGAVATAAGVSATAFGTTLGTVGVSALAGAAGSLAGQVFGVAAGMQDSINWKGVALSAIGSGLASGLTATGFTANTLEATVARAVVGNAVSQGIGVATGLQARFDWRGVAASAAGAAVAYGVGGALDINAPAFRRLSFGEQFGRRLVTGLASGLTAAVARGGKFVVQQVAVDAFGNALGQSLADAMGSPSTIATEAWQADVPKRDADNNPLGSPIVSRGGLPIQTPFPDEDQIYVTGKKIGSLPELTDMAALNREITADYKPVLSDEYELLAANGGYNMGRSRDLFSKDALRLSEIRGREKTDRAASADYVPEYGELATRMNATEPAYVRPMTSTEVRVMGAVKLASGTVGLGLSPLLGGVTGGLTFVYSLDAAHSGTLELWDGHQRRSALAQLVETAGGGLISGQAADTGVNVFGIGLTGFAGYRAFTLNSPGYRTNYTAQPGSLADGMLAESELLTKLPRDGNELATAFRHTQVRGYSVVYEMQLRPGSYGKSAAVHTREAAASLKADMNSDPEFASIMQRLGVPADIGTVGVAPTPKILTWEHASSSTANGRFGVMRLVPREQHTPGSDWWRIIHPDFGAAGGYAEWARPAGAPKR